MVPVSRTVCLAVALLGGSARAQSSAITETAQSYSFALNGSTITISREGASCPGSCVQPMQVSPGVHTLGELEVIAFLQNAVSTGSGLLVDVRTPDQFATSTVPGAVNVPVSIFDTQNPYRDDFLAALGVKGSNETPDFDQAFTLVIFGDGPDDANASTAINGLLAAGYPVDKVQYYRGGARDWTKLGLTLAANQ